MCVSGAVLKMYPDAKSRDIMDAAGAWFTAAPFRKGGLGAVQPRRKSAIIDKTVTPQQQTDRTSD